MAGTLVGALVLVKPKLTFGEDCKSRGPSSFRTDRRIYWAWGSASLCWLSYGLQDRYQGRLCNPTSASSPIDLARALESGGHS